MTENQDTFSLVHSKAESWSNQLVGLDPYNKLLYLTKRPGVTLELTSAPAGELDKLFNQEKLRLKNFFPDPIAYDEACKPVRFIKRKVIELEQEQGIEAAWVACGVVTTLKSSTRGGMDLRELCAPLILHQLNISSCGAKENEFSISINHTPEQNPVLLYALQHYYGINFDTPSFNSGIEQLMAARMDVIQRTNEVFKLVQAEATKSGVSLALELQLFAGVFSFEKFAMV